MCPFSSDWSEIIIGKIAGNETEKYISIIKEQMKRENLNDKLIMKYIVDGQWKKRSGGRGINTNGTAINFVHNNSDFKGIIKNPKENFFEWFKTIGEALYNTHKNKTVGQIKVDKEIFNFEINKKNSSSHTIKLQDTGKHILIQSKIKKILYKSTYCIHCGVCEAECPVGALQVNPTVKVDTKKCIHCSNCVNFSEKGCLKAKSISVTEGERSMKTEKIATSKYQTFGMREEWLTGYLNHMENWFENNNLGNRQVESVVAWLKDSELLDKEKRPTEKAAILKKIFMKDAKLIWEIIWTDFFCNIPMIKWYLSNISWGNVKSSKELIEMIIDSDDRNKAKTTSNGITSLFNMFENSPLGKELKIGLIEKKGNTRYAKKLGSDDIHTTAIAYCLYRFAEDKKRYEFTVSEFYEENCDGGPFILFGISRDKFEDILRYLQEDKNHILRVNLTADLENIFLREEISSMDILKMAV